MPPRNRITLAPSRVQRIQFASISITIVLQGERCEAPPRIVTAFYFTRLSNRKSTGSQKSMAVLIDSLCKLSTYGTIPPIFRPATLPPTTPLRDEPCCTTARRIQRPAMTSRSQRKARARKPGAESSTPQTRQLWGIAKPLPQPPIEHPASSHYQLATIN